MPPWLELVLTPISLYAVLFFLIWIFARDKLSRRACVLGWTAVAIGVAGFLWSLWYESLLPYIRAGRWTAVLLTMLQFSAMLSGVALMVYGTVRFLRSWLKFLMWRDSSPFSGFLRYLRGDHPALERVRRGITYRQRFGMAAKIIIDMLTISGLGWVLVGLGITIAGGQVLEPDPSIAPDAQLVVLALILILGGGVQEWAARRRGQYTWQEKGR